jgi:hypothetical protein
MTFNKLIIFDLDGVLVDSKKIHFDSLNKALSNINKKYIISEKEQKIIYEGLPTKNKLEILNKKKGLDKKYFDEIFNKKQQYSLKMFSKISVDNDLLNYFKFIKENNIEIAIATNSIKETLNSCIKSLKINDFISYSLCNEDVVNPKPNPEIYLKCMEYFNINPKNVVIFEDSDVGKESAKKSGAFLIEIKNRSDLTINKIKSAIGYLNES